MSPLVIVALLIFVGLVSYKYLIKKPDNFPNGDTLVFYLKKYSSSFSSFAENA